MSIDNDDSRDLDQLTFAETTSSGESVLYIAIADVDALVKSRSAIDRHAHHNTTSVYTPAKLFPMLPLKLSTNLTSLNENTDRCAIIVELHVSTDGSFAVSRIDPGIVRNYAKLAYGEVAQWLERGVPIPRLPKDLSEQLLLQDAIAQRILRFRVAQGALGFETAEAYAVLVNGVAVRLEERTSNRGTQLIENSMIAANVGMTRYFAEKNLPILRRVVRTPKRWDRIVRLARELGEILPSRPNVKALRDFLLRQRAVHPDQFSRLSLSVIKLLGRGEYVLGLPGKLPIGHFDLALRDYAHTTAPNRRYPDLVMQRILKWSFYGGPAPYQKKELIAIAGQCTRKEDDAIKVERRLIKCAAAMILIDQVGECFPAIVTGASWKGTWVRLRDRPIEGRLTHGFEGVDVGDLLQVQLVRVDVRSGHIDFRMCQRSLPLSSGI